MIMTDKNIFITFDGDSGAGKTTQAQHVGSRLGLPVYGIYEYQYFNQRLHQYYAPSSPYSAMNLFLTNIIALRLMQAQHPKGLILDESLFGVMANLPPEEIDDAIDLFHTGIKSEGYSCPALSFYVHVNLSRCEERRYKAYDADNRITNLEIDHSPTESDERRLELWTKLAEKIPYLYIVDGSSNPDKVSQTIDCILEEYNLIDH